MLILFEYVNEILDTIELDSINGMLVRIAGIRKYEPDLIRLRGEANDIIGKRSPSIFSFHFSWLVVYPDSKWT